MVFDSFYMSIDQATNLFQQLFRADVQVKLEATPRQKGTLDCGIFAIAICTALVYGLKTSSIVLQQDATRRH